MANVIQAESGKLSTASTNRNSGQYKASDPLYPFNFVSTEVPKQIVISNKIASILPELASIPAEHFYWIIGVHQGQQFLATDFRYITKGTLTSVGCCADISSLSFNHELKVLSENSHNFCLAPLHNHPNIISSCFSDSGNYFVYEKEVKKFLKTISPLIEREVGFVGDSGDFEKLLLQEFQKDLRSQMLGSVCTGPLTKIAIRLASDNAILLSEADANIGASFQLLIANSCSDRAELLCYSVSSDKSDPDFPMFLPNIELIPIISEASADLKAKRLIKRQQKEIGGVESALAKAWQPYYREQASLNVLFPSQASIRQEYLRHLEA